MSADWFASVEPYAFLIVQVLGIVIGVFAVLYAVGWLFWLLLDGIVDAVSWVRSRLV